MSDVAHTNSELWERLSKTDPRYTKRFNKAGFQGTAINATYVAKRLTEAFGPCGIGWRFVIDDERIEAGHKLKSGDVSRIHIVRGHLEYRTGPEGFFSTSQQFGQTTFVGENKNGPFTDEEAPKKSITDCITKCAVMLGIGADIHLGLFDDSKYVNSRLAEETAKDKTANDEPPTEGGPETATIQPMGRVEKAIKWAQDSIAKFAKFASVAEADAWETKHLTILDDLSDVHLDTWKLLKLRLTETRNRLTQKEAA